jgi:quinoprotein glucose dehydrogenase
MTSPRALGEPIGVSSKGKLALRCFALLLLTTGLVEVCGGAELIWLGGSPYYFIAGGALYAGALLLWSARRLGQWVLATSVVATCIWAVAEAGLDIWAIIPRIDVIALLWLCCVTPHVRRNLQPPMQGWGERAVLALPTLSLLSIVVLALLHSSAMSPATSPRSAGTAIVSKGTGDEWPRYGGADSGQRFSELDQINPRNVAKLKPAWTFEFTGGDATGLQVAPLKVGDLVYACDSLNRIAALDAETGKPQWIFDPHVDVSKSPFRACRGLGYFQSADASAADCPTRIFTATIDGRLMAVNAQTGLRCASFGSRGEISLFDGLGKTLAGYYSSNGAPTIARGRVVIGGTIADNQMWGEPSGVIRAFDAVSGQLSWAYDVGRPDRRGAPPTGQIYTPSTPNVWGAMAYDDALGLLYLPTGNATPDYYGARRRPIDDEISSSVLALDIETGRRRWVFQTVHHDVWDYDVGAQPILFDFAANGGLRHALLQATKTGQVFLLDRITGKPISRVAERPAPQAGAAPGEKLSPTQPYSVDMPSLAGGDLSEAQMWGVSTFDQLWCRIRFKRSRYDGPMTPPGLKPSIQYPGYLGGMDWGGASIDPQRGVMIAVSNQVANRVRLVPRAEANAKAAWAMGFGRQGIKAMIGINAQMGTPFGVETSSFLSPLGIPCQQPPWGRLNAVDLRTHRLLWSIPLGTAKDSGPFGWKSRLPFGIGVPSLGGTLVTRAGLTFVGASTDRTFRAFDTQTGRLLWEAPLADSGNATPITYRTLSGRQYVVIAAAGHKGLGSHRGDKITAFVLP